ncbi:DNA repair protein RecN [Granulosicoccus antarcticus]|uniref:DNA repair protein RecN n=1 Tax=Granulosicoccus antarcticus IMCC3135 TaxID=1192854 RepID=A0A2Z2NMM2_9GAMM|nr:DNA repair protein RecN [Granulosicoccus antarcticus]ASJ72463.1 DNA repair protein RecN [Granulosicoccus antarcticus IMCC3135]
MLTHLHIRHFAIIDSSELELEPGMTALTGETGAGKSILLDALGLVLGARANTDSIQQGAERADITASFNLDQLPHVTQWLAANELDAEDDCLIRRSLSANGKSRATINDLPVSVQTLRALGEQLVTIHGQHAYQTLGKSAQQRQLLDRFAGGVQFDRVAKAYASWHVANEALVNQERNAAERSQRIDMLSFQLQEFDELDIGPNTVKDIESEHRWLASSDRILTLGEQSLQAIDDVACPALNKATPALSELVQIDEQLREALDLVESAAIQLAEASHLVRSTLGRLEHDDTRLSWLDQKLGALHSLARKHQCQMAELATVEQALREEFDTLTDPNMAGDELLRERDALRSIYDNEAAKLSRHRRKHAKILAKTITESMQGLNMTGGVFEISLKTDTDAPHRLGNDNVNFLVSPNPGVSPALLSRVASGGELSRISLCMTLAALDSHAMPTLVFDEVDSGVGGAVATTVGQLLRQVGQKSQVLCVTHLPQVASQAHHHMLIKKEVARGKTKTSVQPLEATKIRDEIARMLGGAKVTTKSRQHAQEMLDSASSFS